MNLTISSHFRRNLVSKAVQDLPLEQRVDHTPKGPVDFSKLLRRGLCLEEVAELAGCTVGTVHKTVRSHYDDAAWYEIWSANSKSRAELRRQVHRDLFWNHRFHLDPQVASMDKALVHTLGSPEAVRRHTQYVRRQGIFALQYAG